MKIAVIGAGAMGGALAAEASAGGHQVHVVDVSTDLVHHITEHGLEIRSGDGAIQARPVAVTEATAVDPVDLAVLFVKAQHTSAAAASIRQLSHPGTVVLSLQNGWGNADVVADALGTEHLVFGVTYNSCSVLDLGVVHHSGRGQTFVGAYAGDDQTDAQTCADALGAAGWSTTVAADVRTEIWKKLILNCATLPTAALTGLDAGTLGRTEAMSPLVEGLARETVEVARSIGLDIDPEERLQQIRTTLANAGSGKASMLQDTLARRKTEVEVINGAAERVGASTHTPTPLNSAMVNLIAGLERSWAR